MSQSFIPITAAAPGIGPNEAGAGAGEGADPKAIRAFRPITGGDGPSPAPSCVAGEPKVTLERDGDRITCIKDPMRLRSHHRIDLRLLNRQMLVKHAREWQPIPIGA